VPSSAVFAAAFGSEQPVASNADEDGRSKNRRVEIAPIPKPSSDAGTSHGQ
jgi:outer membrane protein OmpA-like peptidoglycan-associated protein